MTVQVNPVLGRELRERMRSGRAFVVLGVFLSLLILTVYIVYQSTTTSGIIEFDLSRQTRLGRELFEYMLITMLLLVLFFVPGLTAGAISGERERRTLLPLQVTLLRPRSILLGKVLASMSFLVLLIIAAIPVFTIAYLLGGIRLIDGAKGLGILLLVAFLFTAIVASLSSMTKRVQTATLVAYGFTALLCLIGPITYGALGVADASQGSDIANPPAVLLVMNPLSIVADATAGKNITEGGNPLREIRKALVEAKANAGDSWFSWFPEDNFAAEFRIFDGERQGLPAWVLGTLILGTLTALMSWLAIRRLRTPAESER
jgi:ABC-type transport system involved in multi-copper enzyme maturation permease subunit